MHNRQIFSLFSLMVLLLLAQAGCSSTDNTADTCNSPAGTTSTTGAPTFVVRPAEHFALPGVDIPEKKMAGYTDCNNPAHWNGDTMYVFSSAGHPHRTDGPDLKNLKRPSDRCVYDNDNGWTGGGRWIEATYKDKSGVLYGWYHNEPPNVCNRGRLTAPRIGAANSTDNGLTWNDMGIVIDSPPDSHRCDSVNHYFVGGNGDFSVILDRQKKYFYFMISTYHTDIAEQGLSVARMPYADLKEPVGKVSKWHNGEWKEAGMGGRVTPIFGVTTDWHREDANAMWGASIHWNTHIKQYVMLLNRAKDKNWAQEGVYISFNPDVANPKAWSTPEKILDGEKDKVHWYPQIIGIDKSKHETDKLAGRVARLFVTAKSDWEIVFLKPGESAQ